jgi:hypothetical protein
VTCEPAVLFGRPPVGSHPYSKELFERLAFRIGKPKAIVAIARKMLLVVWQVSTKHMADREVVAEKVAAKFLEWSWKLGVRIELVWSPEHSSAASRAGCSWETT